VAETLLQVHNLSTSFRTADGIVPAVSGVSLRIDRGETVAVVGESGSGKTVTALSVIRLIAMPPGEISADAIEFDGAELTTASNDQLRQIRGNDISMIFQEPMTSLNPVMRIGLQIAEPLETHQGMTRREALAKAVELLGQVGIPLPEQRVNEYPHQLSGGMRQRVMIAMALACRPKLLIADEPTTALDVTIQAQILELIKQLKQELNMSVLLITHDLGVVAEMADRVVVMYAGQVVEEAPAIPLFRQPWHPYTRGLMDSIPSLDEKKDHLHIIRGVVPSPMFFPKGCRFNPRCDLADERCRSQAPELVSAAGGRLVRCWHALNESGVAMS
jgi:oligopeptide/dipeptide ABC transporter ATP-binding protein